MNSTAVFLLQQNLPTGRRPNSSQLEFIFQVLESDAVLVPSRKQNQMVPPFLGLITTRACDLACQYCGFWTSGEPGLKMSLNLAQAAINWYFEVLRQTRIKKAEVHFFGGEPFNAAEVIDFAVGYSRIKADEAGCAVHFEVATNGMFDHTRGEWIADNLDTVVLSLDGPADIHNRQRPGRRQQDSFEVVARNAQILAEGQAELSLRACVTGETVDRMADIATWFCHSFHPHAICFETLQPTPQSERAGLTPPDPWEFALHYFKSAEILEKYGVEPVYATADIRSKRITFCPVANDVAIVSPDGAITACYLLRHDWDARGLDLCLGQINAAGAVSLDEDAIERVRNLNLLRRPACTNCFSRWHCAGGCCVNHPLPQPPGEYDRLCIQTRLITLFNILKVLHQTELVNSLLVSRPALEVAILQPSDNLFDFPTRHA